jgi:hypothetical protein
MSTIATPAVKTKKTSSHPVEKKEDRTHLLTKRLLKALEDVEQGRVHTIEPEHHKKGFKRLVDSKRTKRAKTTS